ncbi:hypothetical protein N1031_15155 [Herbiconiux moechotypicola]|uniref:hypothetical protein n=1 Tax=Herbiconiux moechotypicola TaxID=637393 RepID=UPI0031E1A2B5|nr:hypothetical protein [Herbiconiux moechotypicola]
MKSGARGTAIALALMAVVIGGVPAAPAWAADDLSCDEAKDPPVRVLATSDSDYNTFDTQTCTGGWWVSRVVVRLNKNVSPRSATVDDPLDPNRRVTVSEFFDISRKDDPYGILEAFKATKAAGSPTTEDEKREVVQARLDVAEPAVQAAARRAAIPLPAACPNLPEVGTAAPERQTFHFKPPVATIPGPAGSGGFITYQLGDGLSDGQVSILTEAVTAANAALDVNPRLPQIKLSRAGDGVAPTLEFEDLPEGGADGWSLPPDSGRVNGEVQPYLTPDGRLRKASVFLNADPHFGTVAVAVHELLHAYGVKDFSDPDDQHSGVLVMHGTATRINFVERLERAPLWEDYGIESEPLFGMVDVCTLETIQKITP